MPAAEPVVVRVPAKVNLHLAVGDPRPDGYHELVNVFHAVDLHDEVTATESSGLSVRVVGRDAGSVPSGPDNLAWRAAVLLADALGVDPAVELAIDKQIPVAGGMAGGSADAAATLLACWTLWRGSFQGVARSGNAAPPPVEDRPDFLALAAQIGSDVPFAIVGGTAVGTGRGEVLEAVPTAGTLHWAFALADGGIATAAAYRTLDDLRAAGRAPAPLGPPDALFAALAAADVPAIAAALGNDLEPAALALRPDLAAVLTAGVAAGALRGIVSGSGPTCAFLCPDAGAASAVAADLADSGLCRATRTATGPAVGAHVVDPDAADPTTRGAGVVEARTAAPR